MVPKTTFHDVCTLCFCFLCFCGIGALHAVIHEVSSLSELPSPSTHKDRIYIFDIDNVLLQPTTVSKRDDQYGSEQWGAARVDHLIASGIEKQEAIEKVKHEYANFLIYHMEPETLENNTANTLYETKKHAPLYAITSRRREFKEATHRHFKKLNIAMSGSHTNTECELEPLTYGAQPHGAHELKPLYSRGIVFAGDYKKGKGDALLRLLAYLYTTPPQDTQVIFIDDKLRAVQKVETACKANNIPCMPFRYTACDAQIKKLIPSGKLP